MKAKESDVKRTSLLDEIKAEAVEIAENVRDIRGATGLLLKDGERWLV